VTVGWSADRAVRVLADLDLAVGHLEGVIDHQAADQRLADAGEHLDRLVDLDGADGRAEHAEHAALGARRHHAGRRRLRVQAAVARAVLGPEHRGLAVEPVDRTPDVRLAEQHARVVHEVPRGEVVGAVHDEVVLAEQVQDVGRVEAQLVQVHLHERVDLVHGVGGRLRLRAADVALPVDDLALQVRLVHDVELDDAQGADTGGGEVHQGR